MASLTRSVHNSRKGVDLMYYDLRAFHAPSLRLPVQVRDELEDAVDAEDTEALQGEMCMGDGGRGKAAPWGRGINMQDRQVVVVQVTLCAYFTCEHNITG